MNRLVTLNPVFCSYSSLCDYILIFKKTTQTWGMCQSLLLRIVEGVYFFTEAVGLNLSIIIISWTLTFRLIVCFQKSISFVYLSNLNWAFQTKSKSWLQIHPMKWTKSWKNREFVYHFICALQIFHGIYSMQLFIILPKLKHTYFFVFMYIFIYIKSKILLLYFFCTVL